MDALNIDDLYKIYKDGPIESVALRGAQMRVAQGEFVAICGRSGCGKSTLLSLIGGLSMPSAGRVVINGVDISALGEAERARLRCAQIGIVYQSDNLIPFLTAEENVALPLQLAGASAATMRTRSRELLAEVGLANRMHHRPGMLSGGERQRVAIAVALANAPHILLADELTGELDSATADQVMALLGHLNAERGLTLLITTHNTTVAARARRQVTLADGQLIEQEAPYVAA